MIKIVNLELYEKMLDNGGNCLCTVDEVSCPCNEIKELKDGESCTCNIYRKYSGGE